MSILTALFPRTIKYPDTVFNKNIHLNLGLGEPTLVVDDLIESGHLLTDIWRVGINNLLPKDFLPKKILLLGLGGGSNAQLVSSRFPNSKITAVEIDPQMVEIANKYYKLNKIKNLKIVIADAKAYVSNLQSTVYDLVLVDCFVGKFIPQELQTIPFFQKLYLNCNKVLINRIWGNEHHLETVFFLRKLSKHFFFLKTHSKTNVVVSLV